MNQQLTELIDNLIRERDHQLKYLESIKTPHAEIMAYRAGIDRAIHVIRSSRHVTNTGKNKCECVNTPRLPRIGSSCKIPTPRYFLDI